MTCGMIGNCQLKSMDGRTLLALCSRPMITSTNKQAECCQINCSVSFLWQIPHTGKLEKFTEKVTANRENDDNY